MTKERGKFRYAVVLLGLVVLMLGSIFLSFFLGRYSITPKQVLLLVREYFSGIPSGMGRSAYKVFFNIRLPRIVGALWGGAALTLSGSVYQATFRNSMVSPDILGATAGAGFGAALGLMLDCGNTAVQVSSFGFGLLAVLLTCAIGSAVGSRRNSALTLVLTGMVMQALFQALISLIKYVADPYSKLPAITFWLMGSLSSFTSHSIPLVLPSFLVGALPLFLLRWRINSLFLSDEEALSMGVNVAALRRTIIICATLLTSTVVSICGTIGWVGLIIPHAARMLVGPDNRIQLPVSVLLGGTYLLLVDDVARSAMAMEIPIGILTAMVGAPFFIYLIYRQGKRGQ